jgi:hypothetical protein
MSTPRPHGGIVDVEELLADLRRGVSYAARAGLLKDTTFLDTLREWDEPESPESRREPQCLVKALNDLSQVMAPITFADLSSGRNPFATQNQDRSRHQQFCLTLFTLAVLILVGFFMHSLQREQAAISTLLEIQTLKPVEKLHSLRKMAQWENPLTTPNTLYDQYHQRVNELQAVKERIQAVYVQAVEANDIPLLPFGQFFDNRSRGRPEDPPTSASPLASAHAAEPLKSKPEEPEMPDVCGRDESGNIELPRDATRYPDYMQKALLDSLNDFCFQVRVLSPEGDSALLNHEFSPVSFIGPLRDKVALRLDWFLPFLYGLLGSAVFLMRNIANMRTPSMEWLPVAMRVALGGVSGIVIGWFSSATGSGVQGTGSLSLPLVLAFLTGYGIDALFNVLDRLSRGVAEAAGHK